MAQMLHRKAQLFSSSVLKEKGKASQASHQKVGWQQILNNKIHDRDDKNNGRN